MTDSPGLFISDLHINYETMNPLFCQSTLFLGQFSILTETDCQNQVGPYGDLLLDPAQLDLVPSSTPTPNTCLTCVLPLSPAYTLFQPHGLFAVYIRYTPAARILHLLFTLPGVLLP